MTDPTPDPELDELVAAYLDGEATAAERARVQGDPVLLARAQALRAVSRMVAEPVAAPDATLRELHIAAALEASSTSPVVTAMPTNRSRPDMLRFASIAAAVLAILVAVPLLLSNTGGDDETAATEVADADDGLAAMDSVAATDGEDGAAEMAAEDEPSERSVGGDAPADDEAAADDGAEGDSAMAAPESGDAEEGFAGEAPAEEEAALDGDLDPADIDAALAGVPRIDIADAASPQALRAQVEDQLGSDSDDSAADAGEEAASIDLACGSAIASEISRRGPADAVGSTIVDGVVSDYVIFSAPDAVVVFDAATCAATFTG